MPQQWRQPQHNAHEPKCCRGMRPKSTTPNDLKLWRPKTSSLSDSHRSAWHNLQYWTTPLNDPGRNDLETRDLATSEVWTTPRSQH
eukprot:12683576-Alexandrium_andersonii.AAC.1